MAAQAGGTPHVIDRRELGQPALADQRRQGLGPGAFQALLERAQADRHLGRRADRHGGLRHDAAPGPAQADRGGNHRQRGAIAVSAFQEGGAAGGRGGGKKDGGEQLVGRDRGAAATEQEFIEPQAAAIDLVSIATPLASEVVYRRWFDFPQTLALMVLPAATLVSWLWVWRSIGRSDWKPFAGAVAIFVLAFLGLAYSVFPYVVLGWLTIWEAAAHPSALKFVLAGALIVLPVLAGYTVFAYRVFRGKARAGLYGH